MCGRASLTAQEKELEERFQATFYTEDILRYNPIPSYNIAPTHYIPVITGQDPDHFQCFKWGLVPSFANSPAVGSKMINARMETLLDKPAFRNSINSRRCLVPLDGYYEWQRSGSVKLPYRIQVKQLDIFAVAGIWDTWVDPNGELLHTVSMITRAALPGLDLLHDRMPAILHPDMEKEWIKPSLVGREALQCLTPWNADDFDWYRVSDKVNSVYENGPDLIHDVGPDPQLSLF